MGHVEGISTLTVLTPQTEQCWYASGSFFFKKGYKWGIKGAGTSVGSRNYIIVTNSTTKIQKWHGIEQDYFEICV